MSSNYFLTIQSDSSNEITFTANGFIATKMICMLSCLACFRVAHIITEHNNSLDALGAVFEVDPLMVVRENEQPVNLAFRIVRSGPKYTKPFGNKEFRK